MGRSPQQAKTLRLLHQPITDVTLLLIKGDAQQQNGLAAVTGAGYADDGRPYCGIVSRLSSEHLGSHMDRHGAQHPLYIDHIL